MYQTPVSRQFSYFDYMASDRYYDAVLARDWQSLREQLLKQWKRLTRTELDSTGPNRHEIAVLIQSKYGVSARLVESYLTNLERALPAL